MKMLSGRSLKSGVVCFQHQLKTTGATSCFNSWKVWPQNPKVVCHFTTTQCLSELRSRSGVFLFYCESIFTVDLTCFEAEILSGVTIGEFSGIKRCTRWMFEQKNWLFCSSNESWEDVQTNQLSKSFTKKKPHQKRKKLKPKKPQLTGCSLAGLRRERGRVLISLLIALMIHWKLIRFTPN